jgi:hypothetical protein
LLRLRERPRLGRSVVLVVVRCECQLAIGAYELRPDRQHGVCKYLGWQVLESAQASGGAARRAEYVAFGSSSQRTNGTTHPMQGTGRLRLTGLTPLALSQSTTSLSQIGSDWCTMNRWAVLGSNTWLTSHPQFCL